MSKRWIAALLFSLLYLAQPVAAWDAFGHEVIARIAWSYLTPQARRAAVALLERAPDDSDLLRLARPGDGAEPGRGLFEVAATWPDVVRDRSAAARYDKYGQHGSWHYINHYFRETARGAEDVAEPAPEIPNAVSELERLSAELGDASVPAAQRGVDLAWVLHLVGDIHQPLHTSSRVTTALPRGDQGGNLFRLAYGNLHGYWDSALSRQFPEERGESPADGVGRAARSIMERDPGRDFVGKLQPGRFELWARESHEVARAAYHTAEGQEPRAEYREAAFVTADRQAALAGYRLALLLNRALGANAAGGTK